MTTYDDECKRWKRKYEEEVEIVNRCWKALGISDYAGAKGKTIYEHIEALVAASRCHRTLRRRIEAYIHGGKMSVDIEKVRMAGAKKALFDGVCSALWTAKQCIERARVSENDRFIDFTASIEGAKQEIADAEALYYEYQRAIGAL